MFKLKHSFHSHSNLCLISLILILIFIKNLSFTLVRMLHLHIHLYAKVNPKTNMTCTEQRIYKIPGSNPFFDSRPIGVGAFCEGNGQCLKKDHLNCTSRQ